MMTMSGGEVYLYTSISKLLILFYTTTTIQYSGSPAGVGRREGRGGGGDGAGGKEAGVKEPC